MIPKQSKEKLNPQAAVWHNLPQAIQQRVVAQMVKLLSKQISPQPEGRDEPASQNQG